MGRRLTPRGIERREQILRYATERFARSGYHTTSVSDIVEGLGVGKGVFYWYFDSKEELLREILRTGRRELRRAQADAVAEASDPITAIRLGITAGLDWSAKNADLFTLFELAQTETGFEGAIRTGRELLVNDLIPRIEQAIEAKAIPNGDAEVLAHAVLGVTTFLTVEFIHHRRASADEIADTVVRFCLAGLAAAGDTD